MRRLLWAALALTLLCACGGAPPALSTPSEPTPPAASVFAPEENPQPEPEPVELPLPPTVEEQAQKLLSTLTPEQVVGQLFFVRYPGDTALAARWAEEHHLGGYILFGTDFRDTTPDGVRQKITACQDACSLPMLMAVDEEGGTVVRASRYPAFRADRFQSPQQVFARGGMEAIREDAAEKSTFLQDLGINVNLAPVVDVSTHPGDFIYDRAFGQGAQETADYAAAVVEVMGECGMGSVLKHFPGYGNNMDTHTGIAVDERPLEQFLQEDLLPFVSGTKAGAGGVLVSHNIVTCLDPDLPASLSPAAYSLLRDWVFFDGVAMTDDMDMTAVTRYAQDGSAAVLALSAGADMVLTSQPEACIAQVFSALEDGQLSWERVEEAAARVLVWKMELGLIPSE